VVDLNLPDDLKTLQAAVRRFVDLELMPLERTARTRAGGLSESTLEGLRARAKELGLWQLDVPTEYGGQGLDFLTQCVVTEEVARTAALPFRYAGIFGPDVRPILFHCDDEQKERFLFPLLRGDIRVCFAQTEPEAGSDPAGMRTRAVRDGDAYVLNGTKHYIGGADRAQYAQVMAVTDVGDGAPAGISCFIVDLRSPGVSVAPHPAMLVDDRLSKIDFVDVRVPAADLIGKPGEGFGLAQEWITQGRIRGHGARCLGIASRALEMMIAYSKERVTFGQPLSERQVIQFMVADSAMELHAARLMVYDCAWRYDRGEDVRDLSYMVKINATEMASRVIDRAMQVHGALGLSSDLPLEWWYRQLRSIRITEGATEVLRWRLARNLMRRTG
jgi:acyl-CoA dehydrogenase